MKRPRSDRRTFLISFLTTVFILGFFAAMMLADSIMSAVTGETTEAFSVRRSGPDITSVTVFGNSLIIPDKLFSPAVLFFKYERKFIDQLLPDELQYAAAGTVSLMSDAGTRLGNTIASSLNQ